MTSIRILIVEDEADSANGLARLLEYQGKQTTVAYDVPQAIEMLQQIDTDLVIIDLHLPGMNGWELLQAIQKNPNFSQISTLAVTAFHSNIVERDALAAGFDGYLPKPLIPIAVMAEIDRIVGH